MGPGEGGRERMRTRNEWCSSGRLHFFPPTAHTHTEWVCVCSRLLEWQWVPGWNGVVAGRVEQGVSGRQTEINRWSEGQKWNESCDIGKRGPSNFTMLLRVFFHLHVSIKVWTKVQGFGFSRYRLKWSPLTIQEVHLRLLWPVGGQENHREKNNNNKIWGTSKLRYENKEGSVQRFWTLDLLTLGDCIFKSLLHCRWVSFIHKVQHVGATWTRWRAQA